MHVSSVDRLYDRIKCYECPSQLNIPTVACRYRLFLVFTHDKHT
jgi:hypothetical protein